MRTRNAYSTTRRLRLVVLGVAAAMLALTGCRIQPNDNALPGQTAVGSDGYTVTVTFDRVENLVANSNVQLDNVTIGTVTGIDVTNWQAVVTLRLLKSVPVPSNSTFSIGQKTLLGAQYVQVSRPGDPLSAPTDGTDKSGPGTGHAGDLTNVAATTDGDLGTSSNGSTAVLQDGDSVPVSQTGTYPSTEEVLGAAALLLNNGGLSQISTITSELGTALNNRVPDTRALISQTNQLLTALNSDRGNIVAALESLNGLSKRLADNRGTVAKAIDRITPGLKALNEERTNLVDAVTQTGRLSTRATGVIHVSQKALLGNLKSLRPIVEHLKKVSGSLPDALKIGLTIPFPAMTTTNAIKGDYANLYAQIDLTLPSLANSFLGDTLPTSLQAINPILDPLGLDPQDLLGLGIDLTDPLGSLPGGQPTTSPTATPTQTPTHQATTNPGSHPTGPATSAPTTHPTSKPTNKPTNPLGCIIGSILGTC